MKLINVGLKLTPQAHRMMRNVVTESLTSREFMIFNQLHKNKATPGNREKLINQSEKELEMTMRKH